MNCLKATPFLFALGFAVALPRGMGHAGAAKTSTGVADVLARAFTEPGYQGFIARKNYNDLKTDQPATAFYTNDFLPK